MFTSGHDSDIVNAAANRFWNSFVPDGDSTVTTAAASPEHWMPVTQWRTPAAVVAEYVTVTPELVPTPVADQRPRSLLYM
jgi:hypothetical protein